ncbi:MAG: DNA recombination protein RmuC [Ignavibacteria bacterium]|nr:DNA recombination protein RmuC [Ignavibacteria bacterium]
MNEIIYILSALIAGIIFGIIISVVRYKSRISVSEERNKILAENADNYKKESEEQRNRVLTLSSELSAVKSDNENLYRRLEEQKDEIEQIQNRLKTEFENLASKILEEKSQKFTEQNKENISYILTPLREKISEFEKKISDVYNEENKERSALREQIRILYELNKQMSEDANNLTRALKGDTKVLGTWGELILERILELSGLEKGREFEVQQSVRDSDGRLLRPDVVVNLPEGKKIIIDSKVSLKAYEAFVNSDDEGHKEEALKQHINSVRSHMKLLSPKSYHSLYGLSNLDFVIMFIPVEPAFSAAISNDPGLWEEAFSRNIVISSPATLLAMLRTVSGLWRQEKRVKYAEEIARKGGELYDYVASFIDQMIKLGERLDSAKKYYTDAMKKFSEGRKSVLSKAEELKQMGVPSTKSVDPRLLARLDNEDESNRDSDDENQLNLLK